MIPKTIHYCWFGYNSKSKLICKCIKSWKKYCKDFQIIEWNEENINLELMPQYVQDAYAAKKWAFVSDYVRLWVVYQFGGVYLDTDVELIRPIDFCLQYKGFFSFENQDLRTVATGLGFGGEKNLGILEELMKGYECVVFQKPEEHFMPNTRINWPVFEAHGVIRNDKFQIIDNGVAIFPGEYFDPKISNSINKIKITSNTYSIHHYTKTWDDNHEKKVKMARRKKYIHWILRTPHRIARKILGERYYTKLKRKIKG